MYQPRQGITGAIYLLFHALLPRRSLLPQYYQPHLFMAKIGALYMNKVSAVLVYLILLSFAGCTNENVNVNMDSYAAHMEETCTDAYEYNAAYGIPET